VGIGFNMLLSERIWDADGFKDLGDLGLDLFGPWSLAQGDKVVWLRVSVRPAHLEWMVEPDRMWQAEAIAAVL